MYKRLLKTFHQEHFTEKTQNNEDADKAKNTNRS